ncbi:MAG: hypothetical protein IJP27_00650 [Clostridia bacterium]|nr:hypothetical protein [Clostridia bacterium]
MNHVFDNWHLGVTFGFRAKNGWFSTEQAKAEARAIKESGADWVVLIVTVYQEHTYSVRQFKDFVMTPSDWEVMEMIDYLHRLGLKVQLRPMLETLDGSGRLEVWFPKEDLDGKRIPGLIRTERSDWFESMTERAVYYARIAERCGAEIYCLDSELDRLVECNNHWKKLLREVRKVYSGPVTSCHTTHTGIIDFDKTLGDKNHWFYDLDFLSLSCYHSAKVTGITKEERKADFLPQLERFRRIAAAYGKPILFGEFGSNLGPQEQADYLAAFVELFAPEPWWYGLYWWKWDEQVDRPFGEHWWPIKGRPAETLYKEWSNTDRSRTR